MGIKVGPTKEKLRFTKLKCLVLLAEGTLKTIGKVLVLPKL